MPVAITRRGLLAVGVGVAAGSRAIAAGVARRPNILFILADDLGYADLSCYGRRDFRTPNIDALAAQGMRFRQAYANSAVCSATRLALITGRYQYRLRAGLEEPIAGPDVGLPKSHPTLPSLLRDGGYTTALIGKWHLGSLPKYGPLQSGYDHFWGFRQGAVDYYTHALVGRPDLWDDDTPVQRAGSMTDLLGDRAVATLEDFARGSRPFLLSLHFSAPHWPWEAPGDLVEAKRLSTASTPRQEMDFDGGSQRVYAEMVRRMDDQIGRSLSALGRLGLTENTIVVFTSDNGGERFSDVWPLTGRKGDLLEGGIRVPAIVRWPGRVHGGSVCDEQIISMDWMPTLLAAAGARPARTHPPDGVDIARALDGGRLPERTLFWRYKAHGQQACRRGDWKDLKIGPTRFLFNVAEDPLERANFKDREPARFAELRRAWTRWNAKMLPLDPKSYTHALDATELADHYGVAPVD